MLIVLLGLRGSGKTTIGRALAARLCVPFTDLDDLTTRHLHAKTVSEAFQLHGQPGFRQAEAAVLADALNATDHVLALGGGTPTAPGATDLLKQAQRRGARLVYLRGSVETLRARLQDQLHDRPSLTGADPRAEIDALLSQRDPLYLSLADTVINVDGLSEKAVLTEAAAAARGA